MHGYAFDVWDRLGMAFAMMAWIVLAGIVVYLAVRFAARRPVPARSDRARRSITVKGDRP
jgi:hypothetical protein